MKFKHVKKNYLIAYTALMVFALILALTRWFSYMNSSIKLPDFILSHITNFSISLTIVLIVGFVVLVFGGKMWIITIFSFIMAALNFICETTLLTLNTVDIVDALFGLCGIMLAYIYLYMLYKKGLV